LPDGIVADQKSQVGNILEGLGMDNVGIFWAILNCLRSLDIFYGPWVQFVKIWYMFSRFGMLYQAKSGNPAPDMRSVVENGVFLYLKLLCSHLLHANVHKRTVQDIFKKNPRMYFLN
jgi:hypothetical protein